MVASGPPRGGPRRLASFARLIFFDRRGMGMSDRVVGESLETRMDDMRAVMDAAGSTRAALFGMVEGGAMSLLFAATYPGADERARPARPWPRTGGPPTTWGPGREGQAMQRTAHAALLRLARRGARGGRVSGGTGAERRRVFADIDYLPLACGSPGTLDAYRATWSARSTSAGPAGDPGSDLSSTEPRRRLIRSKARGTWPADPRGAAARAPGAPMLPAGAELRRRSTNGGVPQGGLGGGRLGGARAGPRPGDGHFYRHRRLDRARGGARRPGLARAARPSSRAGAATAGSVPGEGGEHGRRRVLRQLRRASAGDPLREAIVEGVTLWVSRCAPASTPASAS